MHRLLAAAVIGAAASASVLGQPAASLTVEQLLQQRLGIAAADVTRFTAGNAVVWSVPPSTDNEIAAAGAIRAKGDLRRLVAWLRDIEAFMKATGTVNVGAIPSPASAGDFARLTLDGVDVTDLRSCRSNRCDVRMPPQFLARFQNEVDWKGSSATTQATALARTLVAEYVATYQKGGDAALGAFHDPAQPKQQASEFVDLLRRSTKVWDLAYPFTSYLESYPADAPAGTESRFYWTRDKIGSKPTLTLHHVVLQELAGGRILVADKQFYASRDIDAALMIAFAVPNADFTTLDLVVSVKAREDAVTGVAARVVRGRIDKEMRNALTVYLEWIKASFAL
jgi:hypothetical protein